MEFNRDPRNLQLEGGKEYLKELSPSKPNMITIFSDTKIILNIYFVYHCLQKLLLEGGNQLEEVLFPHVLPKRKGNTQKAQPCLQLLYVKVN